MTHTLLAIRPDRKLLSTTMMRIAIAMTALAIVAGLFALATALWPSPDATPVTRHPFSAGLQEMAPNTSGISGAILAIQSAFYARMINALQSLTHSTSAAWGLIALSFAYGVFHAAGPGHGKAVIGGYLVADGRRSLMRGLGLALTSSLLQAFSAVAIVSVLAVLFNATTGTINSTAKLIEQLSFAFVSLIGILMVWRKSARLTALISPIQKVHAEDAETEKQFSKLAFEPAHHAISGRFKAVEVQADGIVPACQPSVCQDDSCSHLLMPEAISTLTSWREMAMVVLAAGLRPCTGAIIVLIFAFTQGLLAAGIAAVFAMALGTFMTVGVLASLAVFAKRLATGLATINTRKGMWAIAILEILAGALIAIIGLSLALGSVPAIS